MTSDDKQLQELAPVTDEQAQAFALEKAAVMGDLSELKPMERLHYYHGLCQSLGLNPLSKPFDYIRLNGKLTLYAKKDATDQLRARRGISITSCERDTSDPDFATWIVQGTDGAGRTDMELGSVSIAGLKAEAKANAIMKALTKAKRRLTLSLSGLGMLDESELASAGGVEVDPTTGEVQPQLSTAQRILVERATTEALPEPPKPEVAPDATPEASAAPEPPSEPVEDPGSMPPPPETAKDVCGNDGGMMGLCQRAPGHTRKHMGSGGEWPQEKAKA